MKAVNNFIKLISFVISIFVISSLAYAVEFRGSATERFEGVYSKKKALAAVDKAKSKACTNAFNKFVKGMEESKRMIFEGIKDQIYNNLNEYMTCSVVVEENINKKEKKVVVVMKADVDTTRLDIEIKKSSKVFDSSSSEKSKLAMIFFSRTVAGQRQFDERVTNVEKTTTGLDINEEESDSGVSSMTTETNVSETGGSTLKKADITEFVVDDNDTVKLEAGMKEIFTKARFEPVSGGRQVRRSWRKLKGEIVDSLESGGGIPEEVRWEIEDLLMEKNGNPKSGRLSFDEDNRKKLPEKISIPNHPKFKPTKHTLKLKSFIEKNFKEHPGSTENSWFPTTREHSLKLFDDFIKNQG